MNWYGFIIACGIILCVVLAYFTAKRRGIEGDVVIDIIIFCLPLAIIGARIYYVIFDLLDPNGQDWTFSKFIGIDDHGLQGLAIYGGLIGAVIGAVLLVLWKRRKKNPVDKRISFLQILDLGFTFIILGQAVGRWGNFANQEAYGAEITNPSMQFFPIGVFIESENSWHYATFFYESLWNTVGFGILLYLYLGKYKSFDGFNFFAYCIYYGIGRAWIEGLRTDSLWLVPPSSGFAGVRVSQLLSILLIFFGIGAIIFHIVRAKKAGKKTFIFVNMAKRHRGRGTDIGRHWRDKSVGKEHSRADGAFRLRTVGAHKRGHSQKLAVDVACGRAFGVRNAVGRVARERRRVRRALSDIYSVACGRVLLCTAVCGA